MPGKRFSYIKSLSKLHAIFLGGQFVLVLILAGLVYFEHLPPYPFEGISGTISFFGVAVFVFCRLISQYLYKHKISEINDSDQLLNKKLHEYMSANIQRWVIMEFAILFCFILIYFTGNWALSVITLVMIGLFIMMRPTTLKTLSELEIDPDNFKEACKVIS